MAELTQTPLSERVQQSAQQWMSKLPAEMNVRNVLIFTVLSLLCIGSIMVASASMPYAYRINDNEFHYVTRHAISIIVAAVAAWGAYRFSLKFWFNNTIVLWLATILLLAVVLAIGTEVNGSTRWIRIAGFTFQASEVAKLMMAIFTADYVVRRADEVRSNWWGLWRLVGVMIATVGLIIAEPDLGATAVIVLTMIGVFFLAGAPMKQFGLMVGGAFGGILLAILIEPYRLKRLLSFTNPWADPLGTGYQLTNALMAFGRGEWFGVGLGHSMQKMSYLPEAHTDFMLAIFAEEFGFLGILVLFSLSFLMVACCIRIGHRALKHQYLRAGYLAYGISIIFLLQIFVNAGMNMGMLPTKGLTLPFISYGGSSLIICAVMVALVLKIEATTRDTNPVKEESSFNNVL